MNPNAPAVALNDLQKIYTSRKSKERKEALKGVTFDIPRGAFFGLLGPNGAGKSTLINILAGTVNKSSGDAAICGYDITRETRRAKMSLGVVPQELIVDTFFTVREALDIHAGYYGVPKEKRRTNTIIEALGLTQQADMNSRRLSGGMRRRLLVAKALVHNPPVLILDEPTAGVDVELRRQLWDYVVELNKQGTTVLLTTHYLEEAQELCDTIGIINNGQVIALDRKDALMRRMDRKQLVITPTDTLGALPPGLPGEITLTPEGQLVIAYAPSKLSVEEILSRVRESGVSIRDLATVEPKLEDVFRKMMKEDGNKKAA
ncbi:MAG: ABC transporter ATP-binding protein [Alphaproteobacteria bacterium]|nr:ABC transporter ATP-binding protein [Alphaproteobacteria bacterium]